MRTITLKANNDFFEKVTQLAKNLHTSKSELIRRAIVEYEHNLQKSKMKEQMREASLRVREANRQIIEDFEATSMDGLEHV